MRKHQSATTPLYQMHEGAPTTCSAQPDEKNKYVWNGFFIVYESVQSLQVNYQYEHFKEKYIVGVTPPKKKVGLTQ